MSSRLFPRPAFAARFAAALWLAAFAAGSLAVAGRRPFAPPGIPAQRPSERGYDLEHLRLELAFDWEGRSVAGTATNTLVPLRPGLRTLTFHAAGLEVARVRLAGHPADLRFAADPGARTLAVELDRAYGPEDRLEVAIEYSAHPRRGLYFVGPDRAYPRKPRQIWSQGETDLNRHWFPSWDSPDDRATSELLATVAPPFTAVGNGRLVEVLDRPDGRRTFHWRMDEPHPTYLLSVVVGELVRVAEEWRGIPVEYYVPPGYESQVHRSFGETPLVLEFLATATGRPYPWPRYAQTTAVDFRWGGMENVSATTQTLATLHDSLAHVDYSSTGLVAHEAAHQWFGDLVTCRTWADLWLNEGFASYFEALYKEHDQGADELALAIDEFRHDYLEEDREEYRRPLATDRYPDALALFDATTYDKGALVLHMARGWIGDEAWWRGVRLYLDRFAGRAVETADLERTLEKAAGLPLGSLFDGWVRGAGHPELAVGWEYLAESGRARLEVRQTQRLEDGTGLFSFPLEIAWVLPGGRIRTERVPIAAAVEQEVLFAPGERPETVAVDPAGWLLATVELDVPVAEWAAQLRAPLPFAAKLAAVRALGRAGGPEAVAALARTLREARFHGLRSAAAEALGEAGGRARQASARAAAVATLRAGLEDGDSRVRAAAAKALGRFPRRLELVPLLARVLADDISYAVRAGAAEALGAFREHRGVAAPPLYAALGAESYREVIRAAAVRALAALGERRAYERAARLAAYGSPPDSRDDAMKAMATLARTVGDARLRDTTLRRLLAFLADPDYRARAGAPEALAELGDRAAVAALERAARAEEDFEQRQRLEKAIASLASP